MKILFCGDLYLNSDSIKKISINPIGHEFINFAKSHDYVVVNLEAPLINKSEKIEKIGPCLAGEIDTIKILKNIGVNVVNLANNHIFDMGFEGLQNTQQLCELNKIDYLGAGDNLAAASNPFVIKMKENEKSNVSVIPIAEKEFSAAEKNKPGSAILDVINNYYQILEEKSKNDFVIILYHGGNEYYSLPSPELQKRCKFFVDSGADVVICTHTHVISGYEEYKNGNIYYGIGNFLFDLPGKNSFDWHHGLLVSLLIEGGKIQHSHYGIKHFWGGTSLNLIDTNESEELTNKLSDFSDTISNQEKLIESWVQFCQNERTNYLSYAFGLNKIERYFLKVGIRPFWKISKAQILLLKNLLSCEAHREVLNQVLQMEAVNAKK